MKNSFYSLIFCILIFSTSVTIKSQNTNKELLLGTWKCYHKELKTGETGENTTIDGKPYTPNMKLIISSKSLIEDIGVGSFVSEFSYKMKGGVMSYGSKKYLIEKLIAKELILLEVNTNSFLGEDFNFRRYFKKVDE